MIKLLPYYLYQIDAIESWLDDQAKKGLFLTDVRSRLTMGFEKGEPRPVRYRIDVKQNPGTYGEKERVADYKELGWEYVCELAGDLDIYRCDDPTVPELNTDEETLHEVLDKKLKSQTIWSIVSLCAIPVWLYCIFFLYYWKHTGIYAQLISGDAWIFVPAGTLVLFWTITAVTCIVSAVTTRRRILLKRAQRSPAELRRGKILQLTSFALPLAVLVLCLILRAVIADPGNPVPVDEFPVPTVAQVFSDTYDHSLAVEFPELLCNHSYLRQKEPNITIPTRDLPTAVGSTTRMCTKSHGSGSPTAIRGSVRSYLNYRRSPSPAGNTPGTAQIAPYGAVKRCCCKMAKKSGRSAVIGRKACWTLWISSPAEVRKETPR